MRPPKQITTSPTGEPKDEIVNPARVFRPAFKAIYFILGISTDDHLTRWNRFFSALQACRMFIMIIIEIHDNYTTRKLKVIEYVVEFFFDVYPLMEFVYLSHVLTKLNRVINEYCRRLNMNLSDSPRLVNSVKRYNLVCITIILFEFSLHFSYGLSPEVILTPRSWVIKHALPFETSLGHLTEAIIAYAFFVHECFIKNYLPISVSLYVCYYIILINIKKRVLTNVARTTTCTSVYQQLEGLESFISSFESALSVMPLNWLSYNIGPGLCYLLSVLNPVKDDRATGQKVIFTMITSWNLLLVVIAFYLISRWQENLDLAVDSLTWRIEGAIETVPHGRMVDRVTRVMKKRVSVWHTLPIERALILSWVSSALTFSVFLFQFSA